MKSQFPILEFDHARVAVIEPALAVRKCEGVFPTRAVICFFGDVIGKLVDEGHLTHCHDLRSDMGKHPVYVLEHKDHRIAVFQPGIGAPLAAGFLEETIAHGCRKYVACGSCGVLDGSIGVGHVVIPTSAVRDEGTSYHYLPPSRECHPTPSAVAAIERTLSTHGCDYICAKTWTTDAIYRETREKVNLRLAEGCKVVEMEAAAFFAVAQFRGVEFGQMLFGGDDLSGECWDSRKHIERASGREKLFWLAAEACADL